MKDSKEAKELSKQRNQFLKDAGLTEYGFTGTMKYFYKHFNQNIGSNVAVHCIAKQAWSAFEKKLFGNGDRIHFKKPGDINSLQGYSQSGKSGGSEITFRETEIEWKGLHLPLKIDPKNSYEQEMLTKRVKYVRILRTPGKHKTRWYAQLVLEGAPAIKADKNGLLIHPVGTGAVGIDIGPQTVAISSENKVDLLELADQVQNIERKKAMLQRKLDRSRRAMNPENYAADGTIRRGVRLTKNKSGHYKRLQHELAFIQYQQAEVRKRQHTALANYVLFLGDRIYIEDMNWSSLTHRAKKTERSEKTGKIKRKKRFGKSVANKAPAMFVRILSQKCASLAEVLPDPPRLILVPTFAKASQYDHQSDSFQKKELSQRWAVLQDGQTIQRDLYSAFLLQHFNTETDSFDKQALTRDFPKFTTLHDQEIYRIEHSEKRILRSMGIRRTAS